MDVVPHPAERTSPRADAVALDSINRLINIIGMTESLPRPDTRDRLIEAGFHLFGQSGFEGTSTRALAGRAETNVASIAYHFGGKGGLREACAHAIADRISLAWDSAAPASAPDSPEAAEAEIERILRGLVHLIVATPESRDMVTFVLRDMTGPGAVVELLYSEVVQQRHRALCRLWGTATGRDPEDDDVRISVFASVGQILYFNLALPLVQRRMGWEHAGPEQAERIADTVTANLSAILESQRR